MFVSIRLAISLGGDADTMAAMAGAIAAATPGMEAEQNLAIPCYTCFQWISDKFSRTLIRLLSMFKLYLVN
jgi:ADP-ribosylglycohydrolase